MSASLDPAVLDRARQIVSGSLGLAFDEGRIESLADALRERVAATGAGTAAAYTARLGSGPGTREELRALASLLSVGETFFFRYFDHFRALVESALPARMHARSAERRLDILCAGAATGEEPYTIAILLRHHFPELDTWSVTIRAIDVNPEAVAKAREGRYTAWSLRETPPDVVDRHFVRSGGGFLIDSSVKEMVSFEERNLLDDDPGFWRPGIFDVVFCRNVVIYFSPEAMQTVMTRLGASLADGGFLFLGHSETLRGLTHDFHLIHSHEAFYYQKRSRERRAPVAGGERGAPSRTAPAFPPAQTPAILKLDGTWNRHIDSASHRVAELSDHVRAAAPPPAAGARTAQPAAPAPLRLGLATEMFRQERFEEVLALLRSGLPEGGADPDALLLMAACVAGRGDREESERICRRVLALDELSAGAHYLIGLCREQAGDAESARHHAGTAVYLDPIFAMPHLLLGRLARREGRLAAARRELAHGLLLLAREDVSRILMFGGGFDRPALVQLCRAELRACGGEG